MSDSHDPEKELLVEFVFTSSEDGRVHEVQVQSEEPLSHKEFLEALYEFASGELRVTEEGALH